MNKLKQLLIDNYFADSKKPIKLLRNGVDNKIYIFNDSSGQQKIARVSKRKIVESLNYEIQLVKALKRGNVNVAGIISAKDGSDYKLLATQAVVCFEFIDGKPINCRSLYRADINKVRQAGSVLGKFHKISFNLKLSSEKRRTVYSELKKVLKHKKEIIKAYKDGEEFVQDVGMALNLAKGTKSTWGVIHNDYNTSNILFKKSRLKAIIDFDWACNGPLLIDVGYGAMSWSTAEKDIKPEEEAFNTFLTSYNSVSPIKVNKNKELHFWTAYSCLYLACNFLCDSLIENRYNIIKAEQSRMYKRYKYYINLREDALDDRLKRSGTEDKSSQKLAY